MRLPLELLVATEKFDDAWYPGGSLGHDGLRRDARDHQDPITILHESQEARDTARRSGMEYGMAAGYD
jgi:hypothetical protein